MKLLRKKLSDSLTVDPALGVKTADPDLQYQFLRDVNPSPFPDLFLTIGGFRLPIEKGSILINGKRWRIFLADFHVAKEKYLTDICEGGHILAGTTKQYKFFPDLTIMVDRTLDGLNRIATAIHETVELYYMTRAVNPLGYEEAHELANLEEHKFRTQNNLPPSMRTLKIFLKEKGVTK